MFNITIRLDIDGGEDDFDLLDKYDVVSNLDDSVTLLINNINNENYKSLISDVYFIRKSYEYQKELLEISSLNKESFNKIKEIFEVSDEQLRKNLSDCDYIAFTGEYEKIRQYIEDNNLFNKKIVLQDFVPLDIRSKERIIKYFGDIRSLYVKVDGNIEPISVNEFNETLIIIEEYVKQIKLLNLSPLEEIMYAYDIVKNRIYSSEKDDEAPVLSRDLTKVLLGKRIVCMGYVRIFNAIINSLGYESIVYNLDNLEENKAGHARSLVRIIDNKYKVNGLYIFDVTWDSKKNASDDLYIYKYNFFAKTVSEMKNKTKNLCDVTVIEDAFDEKFINNLSIDNIKLMDPKYVQSLNKIARLIDGENIIDIGEVVMQSYTGVYYQDYIDNIKKRIRFYKNMLNNPINSEIFIKVYYELKKKQFYFNDQPFDLRDIIYASQLSNWFFKATEVFAMLFDMSREEKIKINNDNIVKMLRKDNIDLEYQRIKLTKVLKKVYEIDTK